MKPKGWKMMKHRRWIVVMNTVYEDDDGGKQLEGRADMQDMTLKQLFLFSQLG